MSVKNLFISDAWGKMKLSENDIVVVLGFLSWFVNAVESTLNYTPGSSHLILFFSSFY